jgi:hypothetical protein
MSELSELPQRKDWEHLMKYGYAPGWYIMRCPICKEQVWNVDKRALCCKDCAEKLYEEDQQKVKTEMTQQIQRSPTIHYKTFTSSEEFVKWQEENPVQIYQVMPVIGRTNTSFSCTDVNVPDIAQHEHLVFVTYFPVI